MLKFEDIYSLPEPQIQQTLALAQQPNRDVITNRYVVTILLANSGQLDPADYRFATHPHFQELYLDDNKLMLANVEGYVSRFARLRSIINQRGQSHCNEDNIRRAIEKYGRDLLAMGVEELSAEFGNDAFNVEHFNNMCDLLDLTGRIGQDIWLGRIIRRILDRNHFQELDREVSTPRWEYMKCLLRVLQSDLQTRDSRSNVVTDQELGIVRPPITSPVCDKEGIRRAIERYGRDLLNQRAEYLSQEFGNDAFNAEHLNNMHDELALTRISGRPIILSPIVFNALTRKDFESLERRLSGRPEWLYMKCLLKVLQSDSRTRDDRSNVVSDEQLNQ